MMGRGSDFKSGFGSKTLDNDGLNITRSPGKEVEGEDDLKKTLPTGMDKFHSLTNPASSGVDGKINQLSLGQRLSHSVRHQINKRFLSMDGTPHDQKEKKRNAEVFLTRVRINALKNDVMAKQGKKPLTLEQRRQIEDKVQQEVLEFHFN